MKIAIMGTPVSSGNRGVLALGASLVNRCMDGGKDTTVSLLLNHRDNNPATFRVYGEFKDIKVVNCRLSPKSKLSDHLAWIALSSILYRFIPLKFIRKRICACTPWINEIEQADLVGDVRGGDSFSDIYGMGRFLIGFFMAWTVILVKGSIVQFPQTLGPYKHRLSISLARYLLRRSSIIIARDKTSQDVALQLVGNDREVWISPDVAFSMEAVFPETVETFPPKSKIPVNLIGLNVNGLMYNGGYSGKNQFGLELDYKAFLPKLVATLLNESEGELWLVPHTYGPPQSVESDPEACRKVREALPEGLKERVQIVTGEYDQHELKGIIGECDFFIGSRMHACIAALSHGVPCVGVAYSRKFEGVFETVGMKEWVVDGRDFGAEEAVDRIIALYRKKDSVRPALSEKARDTDNRVKEIFTRIFDYAALSHSGNAIHSGTTSI